MEEKLANAEPHRPLSIAILGTRGIPARYGGFETFAEELSTRLVEQGHTVAVYGRRQFWRRTTEPDNYRGVEIRSTPTIMHKYLETPLHALTSFLDLVRRRHDAAILCNAANSPFAWIVRLRLIPLLINVDGIERMRSKWNALGKAWYRIGEISSVLFASRIVADAEVIADYYRKRYRCDPVVIAYGADAVYRPPGGVLARFGLRPKQYLLYVSRLEPENNALGVIEAYLELDTDMPLVIVGGAPYGETYIAELKRRANSRVVFTGFQFGEAYQELRSHCYLYIQATEVGGTHPALVEGMAYGNCIVANQTPEHIEVLGDAGVYYARNDFLELRRTLAALLADSALAARYGELARARASQRYTWERVTAAYLDLLKSVCR